MRMEQLKYLVDVVQTKSMNKTAERMFITSQAVSKSIKQLEKELGAELLVRTSTGVAPTELGLSIVAVAERVLAEEAQMNRLVAENKRETEKNASQILRICSTSAVTNIVLPAVLARLKRQNRNIIPRIAMVDTLDELFEQIVDNHCDIGLLTYNEQELFREFRAYQDVVQMDLLARDKVVLVMDRKLYQDGQEYITYEEYNRQFSTMYGLIPINEWMQAGEEVFVVKSDDAEFHRMMMKKMDAYVVMSGLAHQYFFSGKSYVALPLEGVDIPLLHVALYRKDKAKKLHRLTEMIRAEMQVQ